MLYQYLVSTIGKPLFSGIGKPLLSSIGEPVSAIGKPLCSSCCSSQPLEGSPHPPAYAMPRCGPLSRGWAKGQWHKFLGPCMTGKLQCLVPLCLFLTCACEALAAASSPFGVITGSVIAHGLATTVSVPAHRDQSCKETLSSVLDAAANSGPGQQSLPLGLLPPSFTPCGTSGCAFPANPPMGGCHASLFALIPRISLRIISCLLVVSLPHVYTLSLWFLAPRLTLALSPAFTGPWNHIFSYCSFASGCRLLCSEGRCCPNMSQRKPLHRWEGFCFWVLQLSQYLRSLTKQYFQVNQVWEAPILM